MLADKTFTLTEQHIKLLTHMWVEWQDDETGAPEIDPKRPYGNSDVAGDVHEILTGQMVDGDEVVLSAQERKDYLDLHRETETALQIVLRTARFEPGDYRAEAYSTRWEKV